MHRQTSYLLLIFISLLLKSGFALAEKPELRVTIPPLTDIHKTHPAIVAMMDLIDRELDFKTEIFIHDNWLDYTRDLREDKYDLSLSEVHIAAWSTQTGMGAGGSLDHNLTIAATDPHQSLLVTNSDNPYTQRHQFATKRICVSPSPSLNAVNLYSVFNNPVSQPSVIEIKGSNQVILASLENKQCDAAVINYEQELPDTLKIIYTFETQPGPVLTLAGWHPLPTVALFKEFFSAPEFQTVIVDFFNVALDQKVSSTRLVEAQDIDGYQNLLSNIWGW